VGLTHPSEHATLHRSGPATRRTAGATRLQGGEKSDRPSATVRKRKWLRSATKPDPNATWMVALFTPRNRKRNQIGRIGCHQVARKRPQVARKRPKPPHSCQQVAPSRARVGGYQRGGRKCGRWIAPALSASRENHEGGARRAG
jgi:hypothetical protein